MREEDVPAQHPQAEAEARLPAPHADESGSRRAAPQAREGPQPPVRLTWHACNRADFRALAGRPRHRCGVLTLACVPRPHGGPAAVAFAVGRRRGTAVARNRTRRRLRAALWRHRALLEPGHAYLIGVTKEITGTPFHVLAAMMEALVRGEEPGS
jgi:ribonuclease P protein component